MEKNDLDLANCNEEFTGYDEYYLFGIHQNLLDASPYPEQIEGWGGSFGPLQ